MRILWLLAVVVAATACSVDDDCSLNGVCRTGTSTCECDSGWTGVDCGVLDLLPTAVGSGFNNNNASDTPSSWGGKPVFDGGKWHLYASEFVQGCGLNDWSPNSRVVRAESSSLFGPFVFAEEVLPTFHHNPSVVRAPDGRWLLTVIGRDCNNTVNCSDGKPHPAPIFAACPLANDSAPGNMESGISMYTSKSLVNGTWERVGDGYILPR